MGFNKLILPEVQNLKEQLLKEGNEEFIQYWVRRLAKSDAVMGSVESMEFIKQFVEKEYESGETQNT
jgi:hypothetical protein